jgi:hypothetical protein
MTDETLDYQPGGVPISPQAKRFGYEFPVYVSQTVWDDQCIGHFPHRFNTHTEKRIVELLQYCYDGMLKKLSVEDDFILYYFKVWYFDRDLPKKVGRKLPKKKRARLAARLFRDPDTQGPWLYIFNPKEDSIDELTKGTDARTGAVADESTVGSSEDSGPPVHLYDEGGDVFEGSVGNSAGEPVDEHTDGQD